MKNQFATIVIIAIILCSSGFFAGCSKDEHPKPLSSTDLPGKLAADTSLKKLFHLNATVIRGLHRQFTTEGLDKKSVTDIFTALENAGIPDNDLKALRVLEEYGIEDAGGIIKQCGAINRLKYTLLPRYHFEEYQEKELIPILKSIFNGFLVTKNQNNNTVINSLLGCEDICYSRRIEDVSDCDNAALVGSALSFLGLFGGFIPYAIAQTKTFFAHSECVSSATKYYNRCIEDCKK